MNIKFYNIEEKDTDFAIIRTFIEHQNVRELFFKQIGICGEVTQVFHSLMERENDGHEGESDIVFVCENNNKRFAIFIEDKIAADPQPSQCERYSDRADSFKKNNYCFDAFIFLCAPDAYLSTEKAKGYKHCVSHEQIAELLDDDSFDKAVFKFSTEEKKQGYSPIRDDNVTYFWDRLYSHVEKYYPDIKLPRRKGARGSNANWPAVQTNVKGLVVRWKTDKNYIDLEFSGMALSDTRRTKLKRLLNELDIKGYYLEPTRKSLSLRKNLSSDDAVSFHKPFDNQLFKINKCLDFILDFVNLADKIYRHGIDSFPIE